MSYSNGLEMVYINNLWYTLIMVNINGLETYLLKRYLKKNALLFKA